MRLLLALTAFAWAAGDRQSAFEAIARNLPASARTSLNANPAFGAAGFERRLELAAQALKTTAAGSPGLLTNASQDLAALRRSDPSPAVQHAVASAYLALGQSGAALEIARQLRASRPNDASAALMEAQALRALGKHTEARAAAAQVLKLDPGNPQAAALIRLREGGSGGEGAPAPPITAPRPDSKATARQIASELYGRMTPEERAKIDGSLTILAEKSPTGQRILRFVFGGDPNKVDIEELQRKGVAIDVDRMKVLKSHGDVFTPAAGDRRAAEMKVGHIVLLSQDAVGSSEQALATLLGEKLDNVGYMRQIAGEVSHLARNIRGRVERMFISEEVKAPTTPKDGDSMLQQELNLDHFMWKPGRTAPPSPKNLVSGSAVFTYAQNMSSSNNDLAVATYKIVDGSGDCYKDTQQHGAKDWYKKQILDTIAAVKDRYGNRTPQDNGS